MGTGMFWFWGMGWSRSLGVSTKLQAMDLVFAHRRHPSHIERMVCWPARIANRLSYTPTAENFHRSRPDGSNFGVIDDSIRLFYQHTIDALVSQF